jgi:hypothetical protein
MFFKKYRISNLHFTVKNLQINYIVKYLKKYEGHTNKFKKVHEFFSKFFDTQKTCD